MRNILHLAYQNMLVFAFMLTLVGLANLLWSEEAIPFIQIVIAASLYTVYSYVITVLYLYIWKEGNKRRIVSVVLYVLISLTVIPCIHTLIYTILPKVNIHFSRHVQSANLPKFYFRIISGYLVANLLAAGVFFRYKASLLKKERNELNKDLEQFRERALGIRYTSHFLTTIFLTSFGKMLIDEEPADKRTKRDIIQFLAYLLEIEKNGELKPFEEELDELNCFVRLLQDYYGERAIRYEPLTGKATYPAIPTGILFFPMENCLKHALISADYPIVFTLLGNAVEMSLCCINHWAPKSDKVSAETGFGLLRAKLEQVDYQTTLETQQQNGIFSIHIKLKFFEKK
ncbi:hypothetical protein [Sphingobacterium siyangense]|uniref:hypothetical protein n=1 Tax=Sphingobacterium siyangense TaxID=459529 RepID=UPI003DA3B47A